MQFSYLSYSKHRMFDFICLWLLPIGLFLLLSDLYFVPDRSIHHKLYYGLFSIPTLIALLLRPREMKTLLQEPLILGLLAFIGWSMFTLIWSPTADSALGLLKPPLHILMLFLGCSLLVKYRSESLQPIFFSAAVIAMLITLYNLYVFAGEWSPDIPEQRMIGAGAFDNPLLSSHAFGFFCIYWLTLGMTSKRKAIVMAAAPAFLIMFAALLATGSRTPLVAVVLSMVWLSFICWNRRSLALIGMLTAGAVVVLALFSEMIFLRGSSFRLDIWRMALELIAQRPFIGHGYEAPLAFDVPQVGYTLSEPHNFALGVLYYVGIIGFIPWVFMQVWGLYSSWRHRVNPLFILASAWLVYGIGAALTEGGGILPRPKEHWYLLWIPLALIGALSISQRLKTLLDRPVKRLNNADYSALLAHAKVIEEDGLGPKVLRLENGSFLKLFRERRSYTSGSFNPYSQRFAVNSERLQAMGIAAPRILDLYLFADGSSGVLYQPLPGQTLRQVMQSMGSGAMRQALVERFGKFLALLHDKGVYFRSLHLGNVLLMDDGEFGLIDIADLHVYPSSLRLALRQRNLRHMQRYPEDRRWLFEEQLQALLDGYAVQAPPIAVGRLRQQIEQLGRTESTVS